MDDFYHGVRVQKGSAKFNRCLDFTSLGLSVVIMLLLLCIYQFLRFLRPLNFLVDGRNQLLTNKDINNCLKRNIQYDCSLYIFSNVILPYLSEPLNKTVNTYLCSLLGYTIYCQLFNVFCTHYKRYNQPIVYN